MVEITEAVDETQQTLLVTTKVPELTIHLYKSGKGPIDIFTSSLGGWERDQLEVGDILDKYGLKSLYAFNKSERTRGVPIRFHPKNGRSVLTYKDGSVVSLDGDPKDSLIKPIIRILVGVCSIDRIDSAGNEGDSRMGQEVVISFS